MYILNGGNVITLMKMYNHDSPDITLVYVHWGKEDAENDREAIFIGGKNTFKKWVLTILISMCKFFIKINDKNIKFDYI